MRPSPKRYLVFSLFAFACLLVILTMDVLKPWAVRAEGVNPNSWAYVPSSPWSMVASPLTSTVNLSSLLFACNHGPYSCTANKLGLSYITPDNSKAAFSVHLHDADGTVQHFPYPIVSPNGFNPSSTLPSNVFNEVIQGPFTVGPGGSIEVTAETPNANPSGSAFGASVNGIFNAPVKLKF